MIDKNGKLFGKINIIDFIVILVLVAAVAVFGGKMLLGRNQSAENAQQTFTMEFYADEVPDYVPEHVIAGEPIYDAEEDVLMGEVVSCEVLPSKSYNHNDEGKVVVSEKEGFASVKIVGKMQGQLTDLGAVIGGETYGVGHTFTVRMGKAKMYLKISDIK